MPPFKSSSDNFNINNSDFKKAEPHAIGSNAIITSGLLKEKENEKDEKIKDLNSKIRDLQKEIDSLENDKKFLVSKQDSSEEYVHSSSLYETKDGNLVTSLPSSHPVMEQIKREETVEKLKKGVKNLFFALQEEENNRQSVDWNKELEVSQVSEDIRNLILGNPVEKVFSSYHYSQRKDMFHADATYVINTFPDLFNDLEKIKQINFCNEFEGKETTFSGVAVFYENDLYFIMKNGQRILLKNTIQDRTYPQITKYGPDFTGYGKTYKNRFLFVNFAFAEMNSSAGHHPNLFSGKRCNIENVKKVADSDKFFDGIDPETVYNKESRCIVIDHPLFVDGKFENRTFIGA